MYKLAVNDISQTAMANEEKSKAKAAPNIAKVPKKSEAITTTVVHESTSKYRGNSNITLSLRSNIFTKRNTILAKLQILDAKAHCLLLF